MVANVSLIPELGAATAGGEERQPASTDLRHRSFSYTLRFLFINRYLLCILCGILKSVVFGSFTRAINETAATDFTPGTAVKHRVMVCPE